MGSSKCAVGYELSYRAVIECLLSAANFDVDGDSRLVSGPVLSGHSDSVAEFSDGGSSGGLEGFRDLSKGQLPEIDQSFFAELEVLSPGRGLVLAFGDLGEGSSDGGESGEGS